MSFVFDNETLPAGKVDLDTYPGVAAINKVLGAEWNVLAAALTDMSNAIKAAQFHGLVSTPTAPLSPSGGVRLRSNAGALEVSENGQAYASIHPAMHLVNLDNDFAVGDGSDALPVADTNYNLLPLTGTGPVTLTATPLTSGGVNNSTILRLVGFVTSGVVVPSGSGSQVELKGGVPLVLMPGDSVELYYRSNAVPDGGTWYEIGRSIAGV